jgi:CBS domain-containing protein
MRVKDIMITDIETCTPHSDLESVAITMWNKDCGSVPVMNEGKPVGMITDRDISIAAATQHRLLSDIKVSDVKDGQVITCKPEQDIKEALKLMTQSRIRRLPVIDTRGQLAGVLSMGDIVANVSEDGALSEDLSCKDVVSTLKKVYVHH